MVADARRKRQNTDVCRTEFANGLPSRCFGGQPKASHGQAVMIHVAWPGFSVRKESEKESRSEDGVVFSFGTAERGSRAAVLGSLGD